MSVPSSNLGLLDMGVRLAIFNKFSTYFNSRTMDSSVLFYPNEVAQREHSDKQGASVVDFISTFRTVTQFSWGRQRSTVSSIGVPVSYTDSNMASQIFVKAIPLDLTYEIVFWHHDLEVMNRMLEDYFFWVHNNPT